MLMTYDRSSAQDPRAKQRSAAAHHVADSVLRGMNHHFMPRLGR
jgi:hypothetical protein